jgi:hypothetical protein
VRVSEKIFALHNGRVKKLRKREAATNHQNFSLTVFLPSSMIAPVKHQAPQDGYPIRGLVQNYAIIARNEWGDDSITPHASQAINDAQRNPTAHAI